MQGYYDSPQITRLDVGQGYIVAMGDDPDKEKLYKEKRLQFPTAVEANLWYIGFNWLDPVVGAGKTPEGARRNKLLRQAISIALDWEEQIAIFEKGRGRPLMAPCRRGFLAGVTTALRLSILLSTQRGRTAASNAVRSKTLKSS